MTVNVCVIKITEGNEVYNRAEATFDVIILWICFRNNDKYHTTEPRTQTTPNKLNNKNMYIQAYHFSNYRMPKKGEKLERNQRKITKIRIRLQIKIDL